ncbi:lrr receptor-like serine/threonine-protein kinase efr [Quercus suber]|uniref:Lrr receptor-like serine/threonine-protein kinase efr n=1 Tax=Quercus suber TaxID=58331 RepID=A0AAW0K4S6_QUESU
MEVVDDGLLRIEDGRDVTVLQTILSSILELGLRCSEELPNGRFDIKDVVAKVNKIKLTLLGNRNRGRYYRKFNGSIAVSSRVYPSVFFVYIDGTRIVGHATFEYSVSLGCKLIMPIERPSIHLLLAFLLVHSCVLQLSQSASNFTDQSALIAFNSKINNAHSAGNWSTTTNFCNWIGVTCSLRRQRVTALNLSYLGLQGTISPHVGNLSFLVSLDLSNNSFYGFLPHEISRLHRLRELVLSYNLLEGSIPPTIHNCHKLEYLSLPGNKFNGSIPKDLGMLPMLRYLDLDGNRLMGAIPWSLSNVSSLEFLNLESNLLVGTIPNNILNISSLQEISLVQNSLYGNLPLDAGLSCTNLEILYLAHNKLSGHIQSDISNCSNLAEVDFGRNSLSGPIPKSLGNLKYLRVLVLYDNQLTAEPGEQEMTFLSSLSSCIFLEELVISFNSLNTTIPDYIGNLSISLKKFIASYNQIKGQIPMKIGSLKNLTFLDLSYNNLTGNIPSTLGGVEGLQRLHLRVNNIGGNIPKELCQLRNLGQLVLSHNKISGSIPNCIGNLNLLQRLNLSHNGLTSSIPLEVWSLENMLFLDLSSNYFGGSLSPNMRELDAIIFIDLIEEGRDVTALQTILSSILELGLRCSEELPNGRLDIKDVVAKVNKIKLTLLGNRNRGV